MSITFIVLFIFELIILAFVFCLGMYYENHLMMRRLEEVAKEVSPCCGNCMEYNGRYCTKYWNNMDEDYLDKDRDSKEPDDEVCEDWEYDPDWVEEE